MYYRFLNVSRNADEKEIRKQYKIIARRVHPDKRNSIHQNRNFENENQSSSLGSTSISFPLLQRGYEVLMNPRLRRTYDFLLENSIEAGEEETDILQVARKYGLSQSSSSSGMGSVNSEELDSTTLLMRKCESAHSLEEIIRCILEVDGLKFRSLEEYVWSRREQVEREIDMWRKTAIKQERLNVWFDVSTSTVDNPSCLLDSSLLTELADYINQRTSETGRSAILFATRNVNMLKSGELGKLCLFLCLLGADINTQNCGGFSAIMYIAGKEEISPGKDDLIVGTNAEFNISHFYNGSIRSQAFRGSPQSQSLSFSHLFNPSKPTDLLTFLVTHPLVKADVNVQTNYGLTAFMIACCKKRRTLKEARNFLTLLELKSDVTLLTDVGYDALAFAGDYGNFHLCKLLIDANPLSMNLQFPGRYDRTTLMCSAALGNVEVLGVMMNYSQYDQMNNMNHGIKSNEGEMLKKNDIEMVNNNDVGMVNKNEAGMVNKNDVGMPNRTEAISLPDISLKDSSGQTAIDYALRSFDDGLIVPHGQQNTKNFIPFESIVERYNLEGLGYYLKGKVLQEEPDGCIGSTNVSIPTLHWMRLRSDHFNPSHPLRCEDLVDRVGRCPNASLLVMILKREIKIEIHHEWEEHSEHTYNSASSHAYNCGHDQNTENGSENRQISANITELNSFSRSTDDLPKSNLLTRLVSSICCT